MLLAKWSSASILTQAPNTVSPEILAKDESDKYEFYSSSTLVGSLPSIYVRPFVDKWGAPEPSTTECLPSMCQGFLWMVPIETRCHNYPFLALTTTPPSTSFTRPSFVLRSISIPKCPRAAINLVGVDAVSYTHLKLPTKRIV